MIKSSREVNLKIKSIEIEQQGVVQMILDELKTQFPSLHLKISMERKKFTPDEIGLMIIIGFTSELSSDLAMEFLRKLWDRLKEKKVEPEVEDIDQVKIRAETFMQGLGISRFKMTMMEDRGPFVEFRFKEVTKREHMLVISKIDLSVLKYSRVEVNDCPL